mgnify:CR=1 FL=1
MPGRYDSLELRPTTGGKLVGGISEDTGAESNYTEKVNFRRDLDVEMRREGWEFFNPKFDKNPLDMPLFEDDDVTLLYQFARPNGDTALLAAAGDKLYRLFADKTAPEYIDSGYLHPNSGSSDSYYDGGKFSFNWKVIREGITVPGSLDRIKLLSGGGHFDKESHPIVRIIGDGEGGLVTASMVGSEISPPQGLHAPVIGGTYIGDVAQDYYITTRGRGPTIPATFDLYKGEDILMEEETVSTEPIWFDGGLSLTFPMSEYSRDEKFSFSAKPRRVGALSVQFKGRKYSKPPEIDVVDIIGNGTGVIAEAVIHPHTRWEAITLGGYAVLNNGVDLPLTYREEWEDAVPLYGLREIGVVSVGCIAEYGGYMLCADIKELTPEDLEIWATKTEEDGIDPYGPISQELADEYGITITRTQYAIMWSKAGDPLTWGQSVEGSTVGGQKVWVPKHPNMCRSFREGQDFLIEKAGINGSNLQTEIIAIYEESEGIRTMFALKHEASSEDSLTVSMVSDADSQMGDQSAGSDGVPDGTRMNLDSYYSKEGGDSVEIAGDSSRIVKMEKLVDRLIIYRDTGFWAASLANSLEDPFQFTERYTGQRHPAFRHTIQNVADKFHLFVGFQGVFKVDLTTPEPKWIGTFQVGPEVWKGLDMSDLEKAFSFDNSLTGEVWICFPDRINPKTLCYDYRTETLSTVDQHFTAGLVIRRPQNSFTEESDDMCIITYNGTIFTYGVAVAGRAAVYDRGFQPYTSVLKSSLINFKDRFNEKDLRSYVLLLDQTNPTIGTTIDITTQGSPLDEEVLEATHVIDDLDDETMIPLWCRALFFKDKITVSGKDNPMRIASRIFEVSSVASRSQTQATGEGGGDGSKN